MSDSGLRGAELARGVLHRRRVAPLLSRAVPGLGYAAARLGSGSDVLGLDDAMSRDHDWGCRLTLLVDADDRDQVPRVSRLLEDELPERFGGFPVRFPVTWDSSVSHQVEVATVADFAASRLGVDPTQGMSVLDWLTVTGQSVLEVTAGPVFTDRTRTLAPARALLAWYPPDVERYVLAAGWQRLCQLMPMVGRTAESGDELGSRLLSAGLADGRGQPGVHAVPPVGAVPQVARHRLPLAPGRRQARAAARRRRRGARVAGTRGRPGRRLRGAPRRPARTRATRRPPPR